MEQFLRYGSDGHAFHTKLLCLDAPFVMTPCAASDFPRSHHHRVLRPNSVEKSLSVTLGDFSRINHQTTASSAPHAHPSRPRHMSRQSSIASLTWPALPCPRARACPRCQPLRLVTQRLLPFGQVPSLVLAALNPSTRTRMIFTFVVDHYTCAPHLHTTN
jgi:hypothetical protein